MARRAFLPYLVLMTLPTAGWAQLPAGAEFRVNSYTTGSQSGPAVASDANGNFVVVWTDVRDGSIIGLEGQRFNAAGTPLGSDFQVNSYTTSYQRSPAVASDQNGNFVVAWESYAQDGSLYGIFGRRFDSAGTPQGSEFRVNSYTTFGQVAPRVASDAGGDFVVVWYAFGQEASGTGVFGQRFDASGAPRGGEFHVNSYTTGYQSAPLVASDASGRFVVVWTDDGQDGSNSGSFGQRFDATGAPVGTE